MITRINNVNSENYRILYEKATRELMAYNEENELVRPDEIDEENRPLIMPEVLTEDELANFEAGKYYKWDEAHDRYIIAEEAEPEAGPYYKASDITSLNEYFSYIKNFNASVGEGGYLPQSDRDDEDTLKTAAVFNRAEK